VTALLEINNWTGRIDDVYAPAVAPADDEPMTARAFRMPDALWESFGKACKAMGTTRSDELRRHMTQVVAAYEREQRRVARESAE